jgi:hypothetical protein
VGPYIQQFLQRVDDLVGPVVSEDVDDLAMLRLPVRIDHISQRERLVGRNRRLARRWTPCLGICEDLQSDVAGLGLARDVGGDSCRQRALGARRTGRRPVAQAGE